MYLAFPIGWMYYFGTNLDERFAVPDYWPTEANSHTLPYDHKDLKAEVVRLQQEMREKAERRKAREAAQAREAVLEAQARGRNGLGVAAE